MYMDFAFTTMQIRRRINNAVPESKFDKVIDAELLSYTGELAQILNNGLKFSDNFNAHIEVVADTGVADVEFSFNHELKRVPSGYITIKNNKAGIVYNGASAWTATKIYLKCNVASCAVTILVF